MLQLKFASPVACTYGKRYATNLKHERIIVSIKQNHRRALKDISEALEQKLYSSKDISEAHRVF